MVEQRAPASVVETPAPEDRPVCSRLTGTEFEGDFYQAPRMMMNPTPAERIPIFVGGLSDIAFARASRHDGWVGDLYTTDEAAAHAARLAAIRAETGATGDFSVITDVWTMPWAYYHGLDATLDHKLDALERFARDVMG